jgi:putative methyltransferase (TIGR04325 family)
MTPRFARRLIRSFIQRFGPAKWEAAANGWDTPTRGWDVPSIAEVQVRRWPKFESAVAGTAPLTIPHEHDAGHVVAISGHNGAMALAYVVMAAAKGKDRLAVLDWGGGLGHYALLARNAAIDTALDYVVYDIARLCEAGRQVNPDVTFLSDRDRALSRRYDLVIASSSLWYERDWRAAVERLASSCGAYLYITRMGIVKEVPSFVAIQRPSDAGYLTEYLCWIFNESELISHVRSTGMELAREFLIDYGPHIRRAPEQPFMRGYLFRRASHK